MKTTYLIDLATTFATEAHSGQFRKCGEIEYITHPIGVANIVRSFGGTEDQIVAALLHDVIEDCDGYDRSTIEDYFGPKTADNVMELTNTSKQDNPEWNRAQRKAADSERLKTISPEMKEVKLADIMYNVHDLRGLSGGFARKFLGEKLASVYKMFEDDIVDGKLVWPNPKVVEMFDRIVERCSRKDM